MEAVRGHDQVEHEPGLFYSRCKEYIREHNTTISGQKTVAYMHPES